MIRRRRRTREIPFSFDSFLDIVANVVGIIIRLILVVWVGARSYSSIKPTLTSTPNPASAAAKESISSDPLQNELDQHRRELAQAQSQLLAQLRELQTLQASESRSRNERIELSSRKEAMRQENDRMAAAANQHLEALRQAALSSTELQQRCRQLADDIHALEQQPVSKQTLHYRTPISQPVHSEELLFECYQEKVTFIDIAALLTEVKRGMEEKGKLLRDRWQIDDVTPPAGAFRLRYVVERDHELLDALGGTVPPASTGNYHYGLSEWQVEPVATTRGENLQAALTAGSEFRQIVDGLDPERTAVTFWVYPDSFDLFRRLRDVLYQRDVIVAGRPLPNGVPIASSRRGTVSRGQ
jgi:hypothetical protein